MGEFGIDIDVVATTTNGGKDYDNGVLDDWAKLHEGSLRTTTVRDMITKVKAKAGGQQIERLRIFGHGSPGVQWVGGGWGGDKPDALKRSEQTISFSGDFLEDRALLGELSGRFVPDEDATYPIGLAELHGCGTGLSPAGQGLVRLLAELWHVRVRAGVGASQCPDKSGVLEGGFIEGMPNGTVWRYGGGERIIIVPPFPTAPAKDTMHTVGATVTKADWLSSLAEKHYHDMLLWPIIFDRNKDSIFTNPNVIRPQQKIMIPSMPSLSIQQREQIRARGRNWK